MIGLLLTSVKSTRKRSYVVCVGRLTRAQLSLRKADRSLLPACRYTLLHVSCFENSFFLIYFLSVNKQITVSTNKDAGGNSALQIAAKPLQIAAWLLLTAYRNLPTPYPTVPSPTLCDVPFSHSTQHYSWADDRQTDGRTIERTNSFP